MNVIMLLLSFAPWIVFGFIAGYSLFRLELAIIISLALTVILSYKQMQKWYIIPWVTFLFFIFSGVAIILMKNFWVASYMGFLSYGTLAAVTWGSLLIGQPFTLQYAKEEVDKSRWNSPIFIRTNQTMTAFWGVLFLINLGMSYYKLNHKEAGGWALDAAGWIILLIGIFFTVWYPKLVRSRMQQKEQSENQQSG